MAPLWIALLLLVSASCEKKEGIRTPITRKGADSETHVPYAPLSQKHYPWDRFEDEILPITAAHFRCKGTSTNPLVKVGDTFFADCRGMEGHSLPLIEGEPSVYPILITLLNHVQKTFSKPVHITCGHRCPTHNTYADPSKWGQTSKHMIGAEVDFYVEGLEQEPEKVVGSLIAFYREGPSYRDKPRYTQFVRYEKGDTDVALFPWYNQEVFIKLYREGEGRDGDNGHPHPYIAIQVRYDPVREEAVTYTWERANNNFLRE